MIVLDEDEQLQQKRDKRDKDKQKRFQNDIKFLLSLPEFRRFIWWLFCRCHMFECNMTGNSQTFFREGERNIGLQILFQMNEADYNAFGRMQREAITEQRQDQREVEKDGDS